MGRTLTLVLEGENPVSWNKFYNSKHWSHLKEQADRVHSLVRSALPHDYPRFEQCHVEFVAYFKDNRRRDLDNICTKLYIDGLVGHVIDDDRYTILKRLTVSAEVDKKRPRLEITITEVWHLYDHQTPSQLRQYD
jgi:Holliday junction resolvase RusA-like endonuclease